MNFGNDSSALFRSSTQALQARRHGRTNVGHAKRLFTLRFIFVIVLFTEPGCQTGGSGASGTILTVIDQGWPASDPRLGPELEEFRRETGIRVQILPAPEAAVDQLAI